MRQSFAPLVFALGSTALVIRDQQCVQLKAAGGASGTLGQLSDGQNRVGGGYGAACYCLNNGDFTDTSGRGCILTPPTTQFQCDVGASPTTGFAISSSGSVTYNGNGKFYACPATTTGEYNIYSQPVSGQDKCVEISLSSGGSCGPGAASSQPPAQSTPAPAPPAKSSAAPSPPPAPPVKSSAAPPPAPPAKSSAAPSPPPAPPVKSSAAPPPAPPAKSSAAPPPAPPAKSSAAPPPAPPAMSSAAPPPAPPAKSSVAPPPAPPAKSSATPPPAPPVQSSAAPPPAPPAKSSAAPPPPPQQSTPAPPAPSKPAASQPATPVAPAPPAGSSCPADLSGSYQYPHLIVPVSSSSPNSAPGTSYNGKADSSTCSVFNFDIPASYSGQTCSVVFLFPNKSQLETSSYTASGSGGLDFSSCSSAATQGTSWSNAPSCQASSHVDAQPGNSYTVSSGPCQAGQTVTYKMCAGGDYALDYFQDYNPSPIGMYVRAC